MKEMLLTLTMFAGLCLLCLFTVAGSILIRPLRALLDAWADSLRSTTGRLFTDFHANVQREKAVINRPTAPAALKTMPPPAYCSECGTPVYRDPVAAFEAPGASFLIFECAECGERTLKPVRLAQEVESDPRSST